VQRACADSHVEPASYARDENVWLDKAMADIVRRFLPHLSPPVRNQVDAFRDDLIDLHRKCSIAFAIFSHVNAALIFSAIQWEAFLCVSLLLFKSVLMQFQRPGKAVLRIRLPSPCRGRCQRRTRGLFGSRAQAITASRMGIRLQDSGRGFGRYIAVAAPLWSRPPSLQYTSSTSHI
jgi:hypothetical protein